MHLLRLILVGSALFAALAASAPANAIDLGLRSPYLPPPDGTAGRQAEVVAAGTEELIVAAERDSRSTAVLRRYGARSLGSGLWLVDGKDASAAVRELNRVGLLRYAHRNGPMLRSRALATQGDPTDPAPWWIPRVGADRVAAPTVPGFPITVIDDGLDISHPEFAGRPVTFVNANFVVPPDDYHGTMVTSMAAAPANGVGMVGVYPAANVRFADLGALACAEALASLNASITAGASVINMSWSYQPAGCPALYDRIIQAFGTGSLPVAAAGNARQQGSPPGLPAVLPHVLTVGATNSSDAVSFFSNQDTGLDLAAPGEGVVLATPVFYNPSGYSVENGTSFAAPIVSAAAAWVATQRPRLDITQLFDLMRFGVRDIGPRGWDPDAGFGILDIPSALTRPVPSIDPLEPNDDVNQVKARGLFRNATPPLTRRGRGQARVRARLDYTEDPVDVYRVFAPGKRVVRFRVTTNADVDLELFRPNARTVYYQNRRAALRGALIGGSYKRGPAAETFSVQNSGRRGVYIYAVVYKTRTGILDASYSLSISTRRR